MATIITIRRATNTDFDWIYKFVNLLEEQTFNQSQQRAILAENLSNSRNIYLLAMNDEEAVGFLSCHVQNLLHHNGLVGEIQEMYIKATYRQLGIGKQLVAQLKEIAKKNKVLQLEVTANNKRTSAHLFYENQSFILTHKKFVFPLPIGRC